MQIRLLTRAGVHTVDVRDGVTLLRATRRARLPLGQSCRGEGVCAACRVQVVEGNEHLRAMDAVEMALAARIPLGPDERYACRARVAGPVSFTTTYW